MRAGVTEGRGCAVVGWIALSVLYWFLALAFAMGAMLGGCEGPAPGCTSVTPGMVLWAAAALYGLVILAAILIGRLRR